MDTTSTLAIIALAGLIHASFQLSVSVLTLLSSQTLGKRSSSRRLFKLVISFIFGTSVITLLILSSVSIWMQMGFGNLVPPTAWAAVCGLLVALGVAVWIFYYRQGPGTSLWLPRGLARYLLERSRATKHSAEAFSLGVISVLAEIVFVSAPLIVAGLLLLQLEPLWQIAGIAVYILTSLLPLLLMSVHIGGGNSLDDMQKWRESNKGFLQFAAGCGLIVLAFCLYVNEVDAGLAIGHGGLNGYSIRY